MTVVTKAVSYEADDLACEAYVAWEDAGQGPRPGVLVSPTVMGRSTFEEDKARRLAELGYVGFAIDIYGRAERPESMGAARPLMDALNADRRLLQVRMAAALAALRRLPQVDESRTAAIGYCFGGKCVLDLARTGADIAGVASFHGLFEAPPFPTAARIGAKVLALHGWDDPLAPPDKVLSLAEELTAAGADWQLHAYGHTAHGFTNPARETMYRPDADRRSWRALRNFLDELFD